MTIGAGDADIRSAQEVKHTTRSITAAALIIFDGILVFPLVNFAPLAQLLLSLLLFGHQLAVTGVLFLHGGDQSGLLRQRFFLFCYLLPCQFQPM
ncbi:Uncharacterised protein [Serratia odorifera]|uniref:Uncharacterized protein n=1 Tax=Serratia odorifera TaxID=618 RepID=A0A3S4E6I0_SEROD|nr:Uncharacterised protein [Serratia odorifera]